MQEFIITHYLVFKALHIISVISWMVGMLYLPRLFVYHAETEKGSDKSETFKVMERRLLRLILNPAMIAAFIFGGLMLCGNPTLLQSGWMHVKLTGIVLLVTLHHLYIRWRKVFFRDENTHSARFYRWWNEAPTVIMVIIVFMAVVKPF